METYDSLISIKKAAYGFAFGTVITTIGYLIEYVGVAQTAAKPEHAIFFTVLLGLLAGTQNWFKHKNK